MGALKKKRGGVLFSGPKVMSQKVMRLTVVLVSIFATGVLIFAFGCKQQAGILPSPVASEQVTARSEKAPTPELTNDQCVSCHLQQPKTIDASGGKHKIDVGCLDCHLEHPPEGTQAIPECSMCHSGESHYELKECSSCHSDTHAPLELTLEGEITGPCLTCHPKEGDELKKYPSIHTDMACNECHATTHKKIPSCMECHEKHTEDMKFETCLSCHPVHMPLEITYTDDTPSHYCGACHSEALSLLEANTTKHHDLACVYCHEDKHKAVPPCSACHSEPHSDAMLKKFPECSGCHRTAHDLKG